MSGSDQDVSRISTSLKAIADWLDRRGLDTLPDDAIEAIDHILQSHAKRTQFFMIAAAQKQIQSMVRWMEAADVMEERLLDPVLIMLMPPDELRKTLDLLHKKLVDGRKFLQDMAGEKVPESARDEVKKNKTLMKDGNKILEDSLQRERLRQLVDLLKEESLLPEDDE